MYLRVSFPPYFLSGGTSETTERCYYTLEPDLGTLAQAKLIRCSHNPLSLFCPGGERIQRNNHGIFIR